MPETILVTGFEPFGGMDTNPTQLIVSSLEKDAVPGVEIHRMLLPVTYDDCVRRLVAEVDRLRPAAVISCGLYAGRAAVTPERIAINVKDTMGEDPLPDNAGRAPVDEPVADGPDGLFTTLPVRAIQQNLAAAGIPSFISNTAGTYICNNTMYGVLNHLRLNGNPTLAGFIHFPASTDMALANPTLPSLPIEMMRRALLIAVQTVSEALPAVAGGESLALADRA